MLFNFIVSCITMTTKGDSAKEKKSDAKRRRASIHTLEWWKGCRQVQQCSALPACFCNKKRMFYLPFALGKDKDACKRGFFFLKKKQMCECFFLWGGGSYGVPGRSGYISSSCALQQGEKRKEEKKKPRINQRAIPVPIRQTKHTADVIDISGVSACVHMCARRQRLLCLSAHEYLIYPVSQRAAG